PQTPLCHRNDDLFGSRPRSSGPTGAFLFAGRHHASPEALAETMQRRWIDARQGFFDHGERRALAAWGFEEHHGYDVDPELLRRPPYDPDVGVAGPVGGSRSATGTTPSPSCGAARPTPPMWPWPDSSRRYAPTFRRSAWGRR